MFIVGLTGGIASGKSTVAALLAEKGAIIIDADQIARELVEPGQPAWWEIVKWKGCSILLEDGSIDRDGLGDLVFNDAAARQKLNEIIHPRVGQEFYTRTAKIRSTRPGAVLVYDVPLLIEAGMQAMTDLVLLVYVSKDIQLQRLQRRDNLSREEAVLRIRAQMPLQEKKKHANVVIDNCGTPADTALQVDEFWKRAFQDQPGFMGD